MIDEAVLEDLLARLADEIPVPPGGPAHVLDHLVNESAPARSARPRLVKPLLVAAAVAALLAVAVPVVNRSTSTHTSAFSKPSTDAAGRPFASPPGGAAQVGAGTGGERTIENSNGFAAMPHGAVGSAGGNPGVSTDPGATTAPVDGAKIVKTGTLDLQAPHAGLRVAVNRVTGAATGLAGYVADSKTSYGGSDPSAEVTIRIPAANFDTAITRLKALSEITVLSDSENGTDVTAHYVDLQAQLNAATVNRDALLTVLSHAQSIGDILAVRDRVTAAETDVEQLQGQINVLNGQATFSSIAVTLSEKPIPTASVIHPPKAQTGLAKSWSDARGGFADAIEWFIARSGAALIILLAGFALVFGIRYLYPIVRRGLV